MTSSKPKLLQKLLTVLDTTVSTAVYCVVCVGVYFAGYLDSEDLQNHLQMVPLVLVAGAVVFAWTKPGLAGITPLRQAYLQGRAALFILGLMLGVFFLFKLDYMSRAATVGFAVLNFIVLVTMHTFLAWWYFQVRVERRENYTKVLVIGSGPRAEYLLDHVLSKSEWGVEIVGCLDPDPDRTGSHCSYAKILGTVDEIHEVLATLVVDEVVIALPRTKLNDVEIIAAACEEQGVTLRLLADFYNMDFAQMHLEFQHGTPLLNFRPVFQDENQLLVKRIFDLVAVTLVSPVLVPVFLLIAIALKLDSKGGVFFVQDRIGLHKRPFRMYKFRSMYRDAEERLCEIEHLNEAEGPIFKIADDPRVTRVGRFMRKTSLDELPQLINVFLGHMSLVGPRPMSTRDVALFEKGIQRKRFSVRPGIACLREVSGRSKLSFDKWLELDLKYIDEWSLLLDLQILLKALPAVLKGSGAS